MLGLFMGDWGYLATRNEYSDNEKLTEPQELVSAEKEQRDKNNDR